MAPPQDVAPDVVDVILEQWKRERPDLDLSPMSIFARVAQLTMVVSPLIDELLSRHGLSGGEFDVLTALRRAGAPYSLTPSKLAEALMLSRAGMTGRVDRLEAAGHVQRSIDPDDRRSFKVTLTDQGLDTIDRALTDHAANLARLLEVLTDRERATVDRALRKLLAALQ
jgi:DNA-binding MarR family transcriptional regulator